MFEVLFLDDLDEDHACHTAPKFYPDYNRNTLHASYVGHDIFEFEYEVYEENSDIPDYYAIRPVWVEASSSWSLIMNLGPVEGSFNALRSYYEPNINSFVESLAEAQADGSSITTIILEDRCYTNEGEFDYDIDLNQCNG